MKTIVLLDLGLAYGSGKASEFKSKKPLLSVWEKSEHLGGRPGREYSHPASLHSILDDMGVSYLG